jgi:hypothetical protein
MKALEEKNAITKKYSGRVDFESIIKLKVLKSISEEQPIHSKQPREKAQKV